MGADLTLHSFECFANSLLRELGPTAFLKTGPESIVLRARDESTLTLALKTYSSVGRHQYDQTKFDLATTLTQLVDLYLSYTDGAGPQRKSEFLARVTESDRNIQKLLKDLAPDWEELYQKGADDFLSLEAALYQGHSFHPYPKARGGLEEHNFEQYSPEYKRPFALAWCLADADIIYEQQAKHFKSDWTLELAREFLSAPLLDRLEATKEVGRKILPIHPWQLERLRQLEVVAEYERTGRLEFIAPSAEGKNWYGTSSLRSLYSPQASYMLKFSLSMRLTNSIRHLQKVEVERGMQVHDVFQTEKAREFSAKWPAFHLFFEPAFSALKDPAGELIVESIVVCRENLFKSDQARGKLLLATLNQPGPQNDKTLLEVTSDISTPKTAMKWFSAFLEHVVAPLVDAQANYGIYLGAHQQNLILELDSEARPSSCYFRDCQGTGYSELGHELFAPACASITRANGNILDSFMGNMLFSYYLIINSTFNTIASLSRASGAKEEQFLQLLQQKLSAIKAAGVRDSSCLDYLLDSDQLWQKGNFGCCLRDINENTIENPMSIYNQIPNPIKGAHL